MYAHYAHENDAMEVKVTDIDTNNDGTVHGDQWRMQNVSKNNPSDPANSFVGITEDGKWLHCTHAQADAWTFALLEPENHPLDGHIFKLKNTYHGLGVKPDDYLSFRDDDKCLRVIYTEEDAMPIKFTKVRDRAHVYTLQNMWKGEEEKYISFRVEGGVWMYASYSDKADAMQVLTHPTNSNNDYTIQGE